MPFADAKYPVDQRLVGTAPELLAALKQCTGVLRTWCVTKDEEQVINNAEALVAKAEGRGE